jgi:hypothetical protein
MTRFRRPLICLTACALLALLPSPGRAAGPTTCENLQEAFNNAVPNETITLTELCTDSSFTLPQVPITLEGAPGAGFNRPSFSGGGTILSGSNVGATTIRNLSFRDGSGSPSTSGGAIYIDGDSSPTVTGNSFFSNNSGEGGAVFIFAPDTQGETVTIDHNIFGSTTAEEGNDAIAGSGGAMYVSVADDLVVDHNEFIQGYATGAGGGAYISVTSASLLLEHNTFRGNKTNLSSGGGASLLVADGSASIHDNLFFGNSVDEGGNAERFGGGLYVESTVAEASGPIALARNIYVNNTVDVPTGGVGGGGGAWMSGGAFTSVDESYVGNQVIEDGTRRGGGLGVGRADTSTTFAAQNLVVAGNSVSAAVPGGAGGGLFALGDADGCTGACTAVTLFNSTIAGNSVGSGGTGGAAAAGALDVDLTANNSIVLGAGNETDVAGFGATFDHSLACQNFGAAAPGVANICVDPQLVDAVEGNVHQKSTSPTRDKGSNALVPGALVTDIDGQARKLDGDLNGSVVVDIGADEFKATRATGKLSLQVSKTRSRIKAAGALAPKAPGKKVTVKLERKRGGRFRRIAQKAVTLSSTSRYVARFARPRPGACRITVTFAGSPAITPASRSLKFRC